MPQSGIPLYYLCTIIYFRIIRMGKDFVHLHVHTHYSINDGLARIKDLVEKAVKNGMPGMAITDHGNMYGIMEFSQVVNRLNNERINNGKESFKPIFGCEMYVARRGDKLLKAMVKDLGGYHLIVLAKNYTGYKNLIKLVSNSWTDGYYGRPRTDHTELEKYHEGLIVLSGCIAGEVPSKILNGDIAGAREAIEWYKNLWGDDYYLELQRHEVKDPEIHANRELYLVQQQVNEVMIELAKEYGIKLVCTNDVHFVDKEQAEAHDRLICMATDKDLDDSNRILYTKQEWFKTGEEMKEVFSDIPEALSNTIDVFNKVEFYSIEHKPTLPLFPTPKGFGKEHDYLESLTLSGAHRIYGEPLPSEVEERLKFELDVIKTKGVSRLFLIIQDLVNAIRNDSVMVGPGRSSDASSLVCYCLGITTIDPLKHNLLFERFVRLDRNRLPIFCIDFDSEGRHQAVKYLEAKYGKDSCAHILTFTKMSTKRTLKYVAKLEKIPDTVSKALCDELPTYMSFDSVCKTIPAFIKVGKSRNPAIRNLIKYTKMLEGTICETNIHPSRFVISQGPIYEWVPVSTIADPNEKWQVLTSTQYDDFDIGSTGVIEIDLMGLRTLSELRAAISNIKKNLGIEFNLEKIPIDDPKTFKLFQQGQTIGVFMHESASLRTYLKHLHPTTIDDLVALFALYRPGSWDYIPLFINKKNGKEKIEYDIPCMEKYLKDTYGLTIYQEQIMLLSRQLADFSREESYILRDAMGKKKSHIIELLKPKFIEGGKKNGHNPKVLEKIWSDWESFGCYAFMKAHAVSYTKIAYQTAYLKAYFPYEYMTALLESRKENEVEYDLLLEECMRMKLYKIFKDYI